MGQKLEDAVAVLGGVGMIEDRSLGRSNVRQIIASRQWSRSLKCWIGAEEDDGEV